MDTFSSQYQARCKELVQQYGFHRRKNVFIRVINDVCQSFYMEKLSRGPFHKLCRIGFSVLPLCQNVSAQHVEAGVGLYYLRKFQISDASEESDGWIYSLQAESISACIEEISQYLELYLIPFFERANHTQAAFHESIALEKLFQENRLASLQLRGIKDCAANKSEIHLLDSPRYYMALKNGYYDYAKESCAAFLQQNLTAYERSKSFLSEKIAAERMQIIQEFRHELDLLNAGNAEYFRNLIEKNESYSRKSLEKYLPAP